MKKYINLMAVATVCLIACNKLSENVVESVKTQVSCLLDDSQTKTDLTGTVGLLWSTDDAISVDTVIMLGRRLYRTRTRGLNGESRPLW